MIKSPNKFGCSKCGAMPGCPCVGPFSSYPMIHSERAMVADATAMLDGHTLPGFKKQLERPNGFMPPPPGDPIWHE